MGRAVAYAALAVALVLFGIAGLFSIGAPFLLTGLSMLICFRWRRRRSVLWPSIAAVWGFTLGYVLVAPIGCASIRQPLILRPAAAALAGAVTRCDGLFFHYVGGADYQVRLLPAVLVGAAVAIASALAVRTLLSRPPHRTAASST